MRRPGLKILVTRFATSRPGNCLLLLVVLWACAATTGCDNGSWPLWHSYSSRFIDTDGRVFDPSGDQHTTSEAQAFSLIFALVANDQPTFDRVLDWTQANLAQDDLSTHLPASLWGKDKTDQWAILDANSASDADTWIAYSLLEAGRIWNSSADANLGRAVLRLIAKNEVFNLPGLGMMLLPGSSGYQNGNSSTLNPSDLPLFLFERFAAVDPTGPWQQIARNIPRVLQQSARHGFAMDWVEYVPGDGFYPTTNPSSPAQPPSSANFPRGSYDAMRVYLWAGMLNRNDPQRAAVINAGAGMSAYLETHDTPPAIVNEEGIPEPMNGSIGFSAVMLEYLRAFPHLSRAMARQLIRLTEEKQVETGLYGKDNSYNDQCLALFAMGFSDARFRVGVRGELNVKWKR